MLHNWTVEHYIALSKAAKKRDEEEYQCSTHRLVYEREDQKKSEQTKEQGDSGAIVGTLEYCASCFENYAISIGSTLSAALQAAKTNFKSVTEQMPADKRPCAALRIKPVSHIGQRYWRPPNITDDMLKQLNRPM